MSKKSFIEHICTFLLEQSAITAERAQGIQDAYKGRPRLDFENFLLEEGLVDRRSLLQALARYYKIAAFDASGYFFSHYLVTRFPKDILTSEGIIPLEVEDDTTLWVVASVPDDPDLSDVIGRYISWDIKFMVGFHQDIINAIEEFYDPALTISDTSEYLEDERAAEEKAMDRARRKLNP